MPRKYIDLPPRPREEVAGEVRIRCPACGEISPFADLDAGAMVCPWCDFHFPLEADSRLDLLVDEGSFRPLDVDLAGPTLFGRATLWGRPLALALGDPDSRWTEGEARALITLAEEARLKQRPLLWAVTAPWGVTEESPWPGVQAALSQLREAGLPWLSLLTGPCYGSVVALALQADLVLAEPGTVVSLLLPEVLREAGRLPPASTRPTRRLLGEGWADAVLLRREQRSALAGLLDLLGIEGKRPSRPPSTSKEYEAGPLQPLAILARLFDPFFELHGDHGTADDPALVGGLARLRQDGTRLLVLVTARGKGWREVRRRRGGAIGTSGWRKAARLLRLAARFGLPVVTLVGTPGLRSGRRDRPETLAAALGETLRTLLDLPMPTVAVRLGNGAGLAALALSTTDRVLALESISASLQEEGISPDGTFAGEEELSAALAHHLEELTQTYAIHGPLGRRKLLQHRFVRWARLFPTKGTSPPED